MEKYDPMLDVDSEQWEALGTDERITSNVDKRCVGGNVSLGPANRSASEKPFRTCNYGPNAHASKGNKPKTALTDLVSP